MKMIKTILVVGYGSMGRRRIRLASELLPGAKFICVDSDLDRQDQAINDGHQAVASLDDGINMDPDLAFICTCSVSF